MAMKQFRSLGCVIESRVNRVRTPEKKQQQQNTEGEMGMIWSWKRSNDKNKIKNILDRQLELTSIALTNTANESQQPPPQSIRSKWNVLTEFANNNVIDGVFMSRKTFNEWVKGEREVLLHAAWVKVLREFYNHHKKEGDDEFS